MMNFILSLLMFSTLTSAAWAQSGPAPSQDFQILLSKFEKAGPVNPEIIRHLHQRASGYEMYLSTGICVAQNGMREEYHLFYQWFQSFSPLLDAQMKFMMVSHKRVGILEANGSNRLPNLARDYYNMAVMDNGTLVSVSHPARILLYTVQPPTLNLALRFSNQIEENYPVHVITEFFVRNGRQEVVRVCHFDAIR